MYQEYFWTTLHYVILERAISTPSMMVWNQFRGSHAMKGRWMIAGSQRCDNIIGQTIQYHPHGDAAISDALRSIWDKGLCWSEIAKGNWGIYNRRLDCSTRVHWKQELMVALDVAFNADYTHWQLSYDLGRKKEPITLPMKFRCGIGTGCEGIGVWPPRFYPTILFELIKASICAAGKKATIYPDFQTGVWSMWVNTTMAKCGRSHKSKG